MDSKPETTASGFTRNILIADHTTRVIRKATRELSELPLPDLTIEDFARATDPTVLDSPKRYDWHVDVWLSIK